MRHLVYQTILGMFFLSAGFVFSIDHNLSSGHIIANQFKSAETNKEISDIGLTLTQFNEQLDQSVRQVVRDEHAVRKMNEQIKAHSTPHEMVPLFLKQLERVKNEAVRQQKLLDLSVMTLVTTRASGGIAGRVFVDGTPPQEDVLVLAFDNHGYFAGASDVVSPETGNYAITGLASDSFYVVTRSEVYVDQIYKNIKAPLASMDAWRQAEKVFVPQAILGGIDFNLNAGVKISGTITASGAPIDDGAIVDIVVTTTDDSSAIAARSIVTAAGYYEMVLPATGTFKIQAKVAGYKPTWHPSQSTWVNATVVTIVDLNSTPVVDFQLKENVSGPTGEISGSVTPPAFFIAAAFDVKDTSFVQMGLTIGVNYTIPDLPPGDYFVYGNDYLGSILFLDPLNSRGEFYDGADGTHSLAAAKPVTVVAEQTTEEINFTLDAGATIKGRVVNSDNAPLDSLSLLLINADILAGDAPFLSKLELHVLSTDVDGNYALPGLRPGTYFLRTFSDYVLVFGATTGILDGKHKGRVIDEFYGGETNLFNVLNIEPLTIVDENQMFEANFKLRKPNFITGAISDVVSGAPVTDVLVVALDDTSGFPIFPFGAIDSLGQYAIGPIPQGQYKVVALTGFSGDNDYLTEYSDNQKSFYTANIINLNQEKVSDINFALETGAVIQGYVDLGTQRAGVDVMDGMPVIAYNAESGNVAGFDYVQFNGGYRINRLLPGQYKVATVPNPSDYAATWLGGGDVFDAGDNSILTLNFGDLLDGQTMALEKAGATIFGTVTDSATGLPISSVFVGAYDHTGHLLGYDLTDYDAEGRQVSATGHYSIRGLRAGSYYIRTVSFFTVLPLVDDAMAFVGIFENFDLFGLLFGGGLTGFNLDFTIYKDMWHPSEPAAISIDLDELLFQASAYGLPSSHDNSLLPVYLPLPFYEAPPTNAVLVTVDDGGTASVDFTLAEAGLGDLISSVENETAPASFQVQQNYPNPFNPSTVISFSLPARRHVEITVYDVMGRRVKILTQQPYAAGQHNVSWDGRDAQGHQVSAGVYIARVTAGDVQKSIKMVLVK